MTQESGPMVIGIALCIPSTPILGPASQQKCTGQNLKQAYEQIKAALPTLIDTSGSILADSRTKLWDIRKKAVQKQKDFLQSLASATHTHRATRRKSSSFSTYSMPSRTADASHLSRTISNHAHLVV